MCNYYYNGNSGCYGVSNTSNASYGCYGVNNTSWNGWGRQSICRDCNGCIHVHCNCNCCGCNGNDNGVVGNDGVGNGNFGCVTICGNATAATTANATTYPFGRCTRCRGGFYNA